MTWGQHQLSFQIAIGIDLFFALVIFGTPGITISSMSGLARDGKDGALKLWSWQRSFLKWLAPRLSKSHTDAARLSDLARAMTIVGILDQHSLTLL